MNRESFPDKVLSNGFLHHFHLLYKAEKPSVHLHFVSINYFVLSRSQPWLNGPMSNLLKIKAMSFGFTKFVNILLVNFLMNIPERPWW